MRGLMVLCLCSLVYAAPGNLNFEASSHSSDHSALPSGYDYSANSFGDLGGGGAEASQTYDGGYAAGYASNSAPIITKRFFIHSAPQEEEHEHEHRSISIGTPRKNYNVLFVKAPAPGSKKTTLKITPSVNEDKTVVYVLSQKSKNAEIDAQVYQNVAPTHKPEVFFIKYNTEEEALHAQQNIQSQYDHLGGSTQISNEGTVPVQSVIGSLGGSSGGSSYGHGSSSNVASHSGASNYVASGAASANNQYLPPNKK